MNTAMSCLRKLPIERACGLTPEIFHERYLAGSGKPVILTDAMDSWAALSRWSFDLFEARYGSENVAVKSGSGSECLKLMTLSEYLNYLDAPDGSSPGLWIDSKSLHPRPAPVGVSVSPLYLAWNAFGKHPELLGDIQLSPRFVEDWLPFLPAGLRQILDQGTRYFAAGLMIGPQNAQLGLHYDFLETHAYLAQIIGRKRCMLFSPEESTALYNGKVNPDRPDIEKFPLFRNVTAYECTLEPGELLFMPYRWWHHVVSLETSITVNYNFFNRVNFGAYLTHILRDFPAVVEGLERVRDARAALGIEWTSRGFDFPNSGEV